MISDSRSLPPPPGRVALVTGGTDGLGRAVALALARRGHRVLIVGRSHQRAAAVLADLRKAGPHNAGVGAEPAFIRADLSLLTETHAMTRRVRTLTDRLDAIVCCAGVLTTIPSWTEEGHESAMALSYFSRVLTVRALLPLVRTSPAGRIVLVANAGKYRTPLDPSDLDYRNGRAGIAVAGRTQVANDLFAVELAERLSGGRVEVTCVYPGLARTNVLRNSRGLPAVARLLLRVGQQVVGRDPDEAAETPAALASAEHAGHNGRFLGPGLREIAVPARVADPMARVALWTATEAALTRSSYAG